MSGFEFGADADEAAVSADGSAPAGADNGVTVDAGPADADGPGTVVTPADPEPLEDLDTHSDAHAPVSDGAEARVDAMLYAGEEARETLPTANGRLVATSHRVLAYAPDADDRATLRSVHRPNVTDVSTSASGTDWLVRPTLYALLAGVGMVAAGSAVSFSSMTMAAPESAGMTGIGGLLSTISSVLSVLSLLDDLLRVAGALSLLVGAVLLGVYALTRGGEVVVATEGEADDLRVSAGDADADAVEEFAVAGGLVEEGRGSDGVFGR